MYAEAEDLAGSIDAVAQRGSDVCLLDWKRTKQLASKDCSFGRRLHFPLEDTQDSVMWHYRIQLNIYAWILRQYYDVTATELRIVCLHPDNGFEPLVIPVPIMSDRVDRLMSWRRDDLRSCMLLTSPNQKDLRGGSEAPGSQGPSFSQMVEEEMDTYVDPPAPAEADGVAEPSPKRPKTQDGVDATASGVGGIGLAQSEEPVDGNALENTFSQIMRTDFDISSVPDQSDGSSIPAAEGCILQEVGELESMITAYGPSSCWSPAFRHVVQGALAVHRLRLLDVSRREEVLFLELVEGSGRHVRAHNGQCFFYSEHGHWNAYKGVIPEGTLARCKKFLIQLEGLYAMFQGNVLRDHEGILQASQRLLERHSLRSDVLLTVCEKAAICRMPTKSKGSNPGEADVDQDPGDDSIHWTLAMADTIGKLYVKLLLVSKIL